MSVTTVPRGSYAAAPRVPRPTLCLPGAASSAVRAVVTGPVVAARVLAAFPTAVYLALDVSVGEPVVVGIVAADGVRMPLVVVLGSPAATSNLDGYAGAPAFVGAGVVRVGGLTVQVARWWDPPRPVLTATPALAVAVRGLDAGLADRPLSAEVAAAAERLGAKLRGIDCLRTDPPAAPPLTLAVAGLVGLGAGLTPAGDDVLCGVLVTLRAFAAGDPRVADLADRLGAAVIGRLAATTALSAALLRHAAAGAAMPEVAEVVRALGAPATLSTYLPPLLRVGASSGADLAHGVLLAARAITPDVP